MPHDEIITERALEWAVRAGDPGFADWEAFTLWLEESPAHARAYDAVSAAVADAAEAAAATTPQVANDDVAIAVPPVRRRWVMGALAASLALAVGLGLALTANDRYIVQTAPGGTTTVALSDGSSLALSGDTRLELDRDDPRYARVERGQVLFTVRHDEENPFVVMAGEDRLVDAGTVFEVDLDAQRMQVAVSEGLVLFNPGQQEVRIAPGRMLTKRKGARDYALGAVALEQVGEWTEGRLTFEEVPLSLVAERLTRVTGVAFEAKPGSGGSLSGSVLIAPLRQDPQSLGALLGATVRRDGDRWVISSD